MLFSKAFLGVIGVLIGFSSIPWGFVVFIWAISQIGSFQSYLWGMVAPTNGLVAAMYLIAATVAAIGLGLGIIAITAPPLLWIGQRSHSMMMETVR